MENLNLKKRMKELEKIDKGRMNVEEVQQELEVLMMELEKAKGINKSRLEEIENYKRRVTGGSQYVRRSMRWSEPSRRSTSGWSCRRPPRRT